MKRSSSLLYGVAGMGAMLCQASPGLTQTAASAFTTGHRYDLLGRETGVISPDPDGSGGLHFAAIRNTYLNNRLIKVETGELANWQAGTADPGGGVDPVNWPGFTIYKRVNFSYDSYDRKIMESVTGSDGITQSLTQYGYDAAGRVQCTALRMNPAVYGSLPSDACVLGVQGSAGPDRITKNIYDNIGQLIQVRKAVGTSAESADATYIYSANGKQTDVIDANGNHAQFAYDGFDRQVQWTFPASSSPASFNSSSPATVITSMGVVNAGDYEAYAYDNNGNRTALRKRDGSTLSYTYDALNRMTSKIVPGRSDLPSTDTRSVFYSYDYQNHQIGARFDGLTGEGVTNVFDGLGRQISSTLTMDGVARTASYQYDADGNRTLVTYPDGNTAAYSYDGLDRPTSIQRSALATIASYSYNPDGTRASFNGGISTAYGYDGIGRLVSLTNAPNGNATYVNTYGFAFNAANEITSLSKSNNLFVFDGAYNVNRAYQVNGLNQYTGAGSASFVYDANGNLTGDGTTTFLYDIENRLVSAGGNRNAQLRYDPVGRLYEVAGPDGTTRFFYDGDALIGEYDTSGNLLRRYVHGADLKSDDPIAWYEGAGFDGASERFLRPDWQGSIGLVTDNAGASVYGVNTFDEYGIPGANNLGRFQYTGQAWVPELGMYYYKARFYSPTMGRFMQTDPIGYKDQVNLYAYVANDPVDKTDFSGNQTVPGTGNLTLDDQRNVARVASEHPVATTAAVIGAPVAGALAASAITGAGAVGTAGAAVDVAVGAARATGVAATEGGATSSSATTGLVTRAGQTFTGASTGAGGPGAATNSVVQKALDNVPKALQSAYHGCCGEVNALSNAANAGAKLEGSVMATVRAATGKMMEACSTCAAIAKQLGVTIVKP